MTLPAGEGGSGIDRTGDVEQALAAFGYRLLAPPDPVTESVLNENYRVETDAGARFLRFVRAKRAAERLRFEQRVVQWARERGVPAVLPELPSGRDEPFVRASGHLVQLYPWVEGRHAEATPEDAHLLGETEARIHLALEEFADSGMPAGGSGASWDAEQAIQVLSRVDDLIRYYPAPPAESLRVQETLRFQLELLESGAARPASDFAALPVQTCHGDFHNRNVILGAAGEVAAVVDWEVASVIPPVFELLRAISFSGYLDVRLLEPYVEGYGCIRRLSAAECELGVEMWWQSRLHSTWIYGERFIRGNRAVDRFLDEEDALLRRFADRAYRESLAATLRRLAGA